MDIAVHPMKHFELLKTDLKMHGESILEDVGLSLEAYRNGDFETSGKKMGEIIKLATHANAMEAEAEAEAKAEVAEEKTWKDIYPKDNREMVTEIAQGLLEATKVGTFNFTNLLICIYEADQAALALYESVETLEDAWKKKDWQEAIGGVIAAVAFYQGMEQALPVCEAVDSKSLNWTEVNKISELTKNPEKTIKVVGENIVFNGVTITKEFTEAMTAWDKKEYKKFGTLLGETLETATYQKKNLFLF